MKLKKINKWVQQEYQNVNEYVGSNNGKTLRMNVNTYFRTTCFAIQDQAFTNMVRSRQS